MQRAPPWTQTLGAIGLRPMLLTEEDFVKQAIFNIVNSFQQPDFTSSMVQGASVSESRVSPDRHRYNVAILFTLTKKSLDQDTDWKKMKSLLGEDAEQFELFAKLYSEYKQTFKVKQTDLGRV